MEVININKYQAIIGDEDAWRVLNNYLSQGKPYSSVLVLVDDHTEKFCFPILKSKVNREVEMIRIPSGERNKTLLSCQKIWSEMIHSGADRDAIMVNLGGGMVGDLGGFCAATFKRGIDFIQMPTTLLSMVDASVGGKLGMDFPGPDEYLVKNAVGLFRNPVAVIIIPEFLKSLPERELLSGYAEIIKHALISDKNLWEQLQSYRQVSEIPFEELVPSSIEIKKNVVIKDPKETGLRKTLNFGHTIGHALESLFLKPEHNLLHGEAVAIGMICSSYLSNKAGFLSPEDMDLVSKYILRFYKKVHIPESRINDLMMIMKKDKKNAAGKINFTLLKKPGEAVINQTFEESVILESLTYYNSLQV